MMNLLVYIYLLLYVIYIILGPYFITRLIRGKKLNITKNIPKILKRTVFISYIALLYNAYYFYNPKIESFINALIINFLAAIAFTAKWYEQRNSHPDYYPGIIMHFLLILPLLFSLFYYNLQLDRLKFGSLSKFTIFLLIIYLILEKYIYNSGTDFYDLLFSNLENEKDIK